MGLPVCLSTATLAAPVTVPGTGLVSVYTGGPVGLPVYSLSPTQGEIDPVMTFDTSSYADAVGSDGTLTLNVAQLHTPTTELFTSLSVYALTSAYSVSSPVFATISPNVNPGNATLIETVAIDTTGTGAVTFAIPEATIESWADSPSTNYGVVIVQSAAYTPIGADHSDIQFVATGDGAPSLTFDAPEPASITLLGVAVVGLLARRRARSA